MAAPPLRSAQARAGAIIVAMVIVAAVLAPLVLPWDPAYQDLPHRLDGPTWQHWFGLDDLRSLQWSDVAHQSQMPSQITLELINAQVAFVLRLVFLLLEHSHSLAHQFKRL